jgi:hypothetical protein
MDIYLLVFLIAIIFFIFLYVYYKKYYNKYDINNDMEWNLSILDDDIILYSTDYKYLIELTKQINTYNTATVINILDRNDKNDFIITDYKCNILRKIKNFTENNFLIVNNIDSSRYNIISYKGLPKIYLYEKKEDNPYYINSDYGFYGIPKEKINKRTELSISDYIINKFITKNTYYFPEYLIFY